MGLLTSPACARCGKSDQIVQEGRTIGGINGMIIFCENSGAIVTWVPLPPKK